MLAVLVPAGAWAASYDKSEYEWCFNKMPRFYDESFQACVDSNCDRISNKKLTQKRACYRRCRGEATAACQARRAETAKTPASNAPGASTSVAPSPREGQIPARGTPASPDASPDTGAPGTSAAPSSAGAQPQASVPARSAPGTESAEVPREEGFFNRLWQGLGGSPEPAQPQTPAAGGTAGGGPADPSAGAEETERKGFFTRLMDGVGNGMTEGFNADFAWCRDKSGGHFQELMRDCSRGCMSGPSAASNRRQACLQSCRKESVATCIAKRDGK
jgi:hypothetical protein